MLPLGSDEQPLYEFGKMNRAKDRSLGNPLQVPAQDLGKGGVFPLHALQPAIAVM